MRPSASGPATKSFRMSMHAGFVKYVQLGPVGFGNVFSGESTLGWPICDQALIEQQYVVKVLFYTRKIVMYNHHCFSFGCKAFENFDDALFSGDVHSYKGFI